MGLDVALVLAGLAVLAGSAVQGGVGFGMTLIATPCVMLADPSLMPGSLLMTAAVLALFSVARDRHEVDWPALGWAFAGRAPGTAVGAGLVAVASPRLLGALVGAAVLGGVLVTARTVEIPIRRSSLVVAGAVAGVSATTTSIGGPPLALLYQHTPGPRMRGTLGVFFLAGALLSLLALAVTRELELREVLAGGFMLPFMAAGFSLSTPLRRRLDAGWLRHAVLLVAGVSAIVLLARSIL
ncbi:MAG: TSUP family transporter [Micromonosporaceae bacterium]